MLAFIDESGCSGFTFPQGSDPVFAVAMVIFAGSQDAAKTEVLVRQLHSKLRHRPEFKFSKCRDDVRDGFFAAVSDQGDLRMTDSARDPLTQLADMCVGAIARAYRDRPQPDRWLKMLRPRIDDIRVYN